MLGAPWKRISPLLDELLELTPPARTALVAKIRLASPDLAAELDRLLAADAGSGGLLDRGLGEESAKPEELEARLLGERAGAYRLTALGARGWVSYAAERADGMYGASGRWCWGASAGASPALPTGARDSRWTRSPGNRASA